VSESEREHHERVQGVRERALLLERAAAGLAHEGKNPLHTMALHLHLLADKLGKLAPSESGLSRHAQALRDGIGKVDALLRAFADLAAPGHAEPDVAAALGRALLIFGYEARRGGGQIAEPKGAKVARVEAPASAVADLVAHAVLAALTLARGGGTVTSEVRAGGSAVLLLLEAQGGVAIAEEAQPHLDAVRAIAGELRAELSIAAPAAGSARLSISLPRAVND
jgi:hypothetical protein